MFFKTKTVRDALEGTGWDRLEMTDISFHEFLKKYGNYTCKFPAKIKRNITYYELYKKSCSDLQFYIFQNGNTVDFNSMNPFEDALCLVYSRNDHYTVEIFIYSQEPFTETILLKDLTLLKNLFDDFNILNMDGKYIENKDALYQNSREGYVAISKRTLAGPFRDESEETSFHIVMRYLCPTAQCILANR